MIIPSKIILQYCLTEKSSIQEKKLNKYTFFVHQKSNKHTITYSIEKFFNVKVEKINIVNRKGKLKLHKSKKAPSGYTSKRKIAIITLAKNNTINIK